MINIVEGEFDPTTLVMNIIALVLVILVLITIIPYISGVFASGLCACP